MFDRRKLIIATKHKKQVVIAPILERELGVICMVDEDFDTDALGTFSGEIERQTDPISTARQKCLMAMKKNNCDLGIASEGSFGPHPTIYFVSADEEILILIDIKNNIEIIAKEISVDTNFNGREVNSQNELLEFAKDAEFPSHGLILRKSSHDLVDVYKGISDMETLMEIYEGLSAKHSSVYVETDMRAMYNPKRMNVIASLTEKLIQKIKSICPQCNMPGFDVIELKKGLPCDLCRAPTNSTLSCIYACQHCQFTNEVYFPNQKTTEDPMYCDQCNP